ncbi:hypothetical protein ACQ4M4_10230 [Leptolyngbya sp. AN02str]|uniref:hypothetical protein n=1 Tax=Leptolyngbya sp. AN02str TaxID=3423363 RepID=UPI003D31010D
MRFHSLFSQSAGSSVRMAIATIAPVVLTSACAIAVSQPSDDALDAGTQLAMAANHVVPTDTATFLPEYPSFNSQPLDHQVRLYTNYLWEHGRPDVLIIGSSRSLQGVDPHALQQALVAQGYPALRIYNFSVNGATAQVIDVLMRQVLHPSQLPRFIIWADGSRAFNSARTDLTYSRIASSEGLRRVMAGDRPVVNRPVPPPVPLSSSTEQAQSCEDLQAWLPFLQRDGFCPPEAVAAPAPTSQPTQLAYRPFSTNLDNKGFQVVPQEYNPATYYQQYPRVSGRFDDNYLAFRLSGVQESATRAFANYARGYQIPLVFVSLPLNRDYLDSYRLVRERQFQAHMSRLATLYNFRFVDLSQQWSAQHNYFADPSHLNRNGARAVAEYLATRTDFPWRQLAQRYRNP